MIRFRWITAAIALLGPISCGTPAGPDGPQGLRLVAGATATDTVLAELAQPLVVELPGAAPGTVLRFATATEGPHCLVSRLDSVSFGHAAVDTLDSDGVGTVRVKLGTLAGRATIRITVPELGLVDSAVYLITPGNPAHLKVFPGDTSLLVGHTFAVQSLVLDQFGNRRPDLPSLQALDRAVTATGLILASQEIGRGRVVARVGPVVDTAFVSVVPDVVLSANSTGEVQVIKTDGTVLRRTVVINFTPLTADWSPDGSLLAFDNIAGPLQVWKPDGTLQVLSAPNALAYYPKFSPDGQWIYYSHQAAGTGWSIHKVRPDGSGDSLVYQATGEEVAPSPSPDGTRLAFARAAPGELAILDLSTRAVHELGPGHTPAWRAQGDWIAFLDLATRSIGIIRPDGTGRRLLSQPGLQFDLGLSWSSDGAWLVGKSEKGIALIEFSSGTTLPLRLSASYSPAAWRP